MLRISIRFHPTVYNRFRIRCIESERKALGRNEYYLPYQNLRTKGPSCRDFLMVYFYTVVDASYSSDHILN